MNVSRRSDSTRFCRLRRVLGQWLTPRACRYARKPCSPNLSRQSVADIYTQQSLPRKPVPEPRLSLDIELLHSKLEAAKREQDEYRRRVRDREDDKFRDVPLHAPPQLSPRTSLRIESEKEKFSRSTEEQTGKKRNRRSLLSAIGIGKADREALANTQTTTTTFESARGRPLDTIHSRRSSTGEIIDPFERPPPQRGTVHRKPVPKSKPYLAIDEKPTPPQEQHPALRDVPPNRATRPGSGHQHRSKTYPVVTAQLVPVSHASLNTCQPVKKASRPASSRRTKTDSPMGLENEYTVSFDLSDIVDEEFEWSRSRQSQKRQSVYGNEGVKSTSLLNLPLLFKKDRSQIRTEEIPESPTDARRPHTRQQSMPVVYGDAAAASTRAKEERARRRTTLTGLFKRS